ncbi:ABC transporter substrate-binding protein [Mitsuaria sp. GD03876]|uniref:ABC transporter substrate-binding protein n=1 Tax=Mitsuaria sp. GD03876 TaxID=2975399 RepID=UPI002449F14D|nr:ABC transporter substrate-binding protein [Mitsuaria sp. GD03876]MDH0865933.1 ABC transporter substrate-binding protein [Mitsuaria sp. GD03876]
MRSPALLLALLGAAALALAPASASAADTPVTGTILLGQVAPFSGPSVKLAEEFNLGARTYFQALNEHGGVNGHRVELRTRDDRYVPAETARLARELIAQDGVFALFGTVGTGTTLAALPVATAEGVPLFAPSTGAEALRTPFNRWVFHIRAGYHEEADYIVEQLAVGNLRQIAVFHQDDAYGKAGLEAVTRAQDKRGFKLAAMATVERDATDVGEAARRLTLAKPQAVILVASYTSSAALVKAMRKLGYAGQFVATSYVGGNALADALGNDGNGVWVSEVAPFPWSAGTPLQREYNQAMERASVPHRSFGSMEGYLAAKVFAEGLRRAGRDPTRARLVSALESLQGWDAGGFRISYSPTDHGGTRRVEMTMIGPQGKFVH